MTEDQMIALAERYFAAIDARDPDAMAETLAKDCVFTIETHGIRYDGRAAVRALFAARWDGDVQITAVHHDFTHTPSSTAGRIASQFTVTYSATHSGAGAGPPKSNANVFAMQDGLITQIAVYMAGENTIKT